MRKLFLLIFTWLVVIFCFWGFSQLLKGVGQQSVELTNSGTLWSFVGVLSYICWVHFCSTIFHIAIGQNLKFCLIGIGVSVPLALLLIGFIIPPFVIVISAIWISTSVLTNNDKPVLSEQDNAF